MSTEKDDGHICPEEEINHLFNLKSSHVFHKELDSKCYITNISGSVINSNVAITRSDLLVELYDVSNSNIVLNGSLVLDNNIIGIKVSPENENIFYIGTNNCEIKIWDSRLKNTVANTFKDTTLEEGDAHKVLNCFDVSSNNLLLSGGTDVFANDSYVLFWDVRKCTLMGAYWESHTDDVTQVVFNPNNMNQLISGSTDGLINIYDLFQTSEDDALIDSLNTMSSVSKLTWFKDKITDVICCITHSEDLQFWKIDDASPFMSFNREKLGEEMKRKTDDYIYVGDVYVDPKNDWCLNILSGSSFSNSQCLRGFKFEKNKLNPTYNFKGPMQTVRCCWFNHNDNILLTGGEKGSLDLWSLQKDHINGCS